MRISRRLSHSESRNRACDVGAANRPRAGPVGSALVDYLKNYNHTAGVGINGECLPHAENYLELADETDENGVRKANVRFSVGTNEKLYTLMHRRS